MTPAEAKAKVYAVYPAAHALYLPIPHGSRPFVIHSGWKASTDQLSRPCATEDAAWLDAAQRMGGENG